MRLRRGGIALAPRPAPARPEPAVGRVKHYQPLGMASDARQAGQAVILGTDEANGSTVLALPAAAMPVGRADATVAGAAHAIVLTGAPAPNTAAAPAPATPATEPPGPVQVGGGEEGA